MAIHISLRLLTKVSTSKGTLKGFQLTALQLTTDFVQTKRKLRHGRKTVDIQVSGPFQDALEALERPFRWYGTFFTNAIP